MNTWDSYQCLVNKMFTQLIGYTMEVFIDDMITKSESSNDYIKHLGLTFNALKEYRMKLNVNKCIF